MDPEKQTIVESIKETLEKTMEFDAEHLATRSELGTINFGDGLSTIEHAIQLAADIRPLSLDILPRKTLQTLNDQLGQLQQRLQQAAQFSIEQVEPVQERDRILKELRTYYDGAFLTAIPVLPFLMLRKSPIEMALAETSVRLEEAIDKAEKVGARTAAKETELDEIVKAAKQAASEVGVAQFSEKFETVARDHTKYSKHWLWSAVVLGLVTVLAAWSLLLYMPLDGAQIDGTTIQKIVSKMVIISIAYYATLWCARMYRSHAHLAVINRHRQAALTTFEAFSKAARDEQAKNAVLLETTHCIFAPSATGYLGKDESVPQNRIIEVLKTLSTTGKHADTA